jgi:hypothetical protein
MKGAEGRINAPPGNLSEQGQTSLAAKLLKKKGGKNNLISGWMAFLKYLYLKTMKGGL